MRSRIFLLQALPVPLFSLAESGFSLLCKASRNSFETERELLTALLQEPPRGLYPACENALPNPNRDLYHLLIKKGCHIVFLFSSCPEFPEVPLVSAMMIITAAACWFKSCWPRATCASAPLFQSDDRASQERYLSFMETMQQAGMPVPTAMSPGTILFWQTASADADRRPACFPV